jgi:hypothetical protein
MGTATLGINCNVAGVSAALGKTVTEEGEITQKPTPPMGYAGPISTDTDRVITTISSDPAIVATDWVAIFWAAGYCRDKVQSVTGASSNVIKLSSGGADHEGTALPTDATDCIISKEVVVNTVFDGDDVQAIATATGARASISFRKAADALIVTKEYLTTLPYYWMSGLGWTNDLTGDPVETIRVATADTTQSQEIAIGILYDSVP